MLDILIYSLKDSTVNSLLEGLAPEKHAEFRDLANLIFLRNDPEFCKYALPLGRRIIHHVTDAKAHIVFEEILDYFDEIEPNITTCQTKNLDPDPEAYALVRVSDIIIARLKYGAPKAAFSMVITEGMTEEEIFALLEEKLEKYKRETDGN